MYFWWWCHDSCCGVHDFERGVTVNNGVKCPGPAVIMKKGQADFTACGDARWKYFLYMWFCIFQGFFFQGLMFEILALWFYVSCRSMFAYSLSWFKWKSIKTPIRILTSQNLSGIQNVLITLTTYCKNVSPVVFLTWGCPQMGWNEAGWVQTHWCSPVLQTLILI